MDCCNYMQYRHHQSYYGGSQHYYDHMPHAYHGDFYGHQTMYPEYYGNTPYYPHHWQCASSFPDYVYNPKEARIRKAMREATRDRSIGASPMLPRPSARRATHGWVGTHHEEQLMMSPLSAGMRGGLESPVCFPITNGSGSNQFMPPMNGGGGYTKLESPMSVSNSVHNNYLQPNPLAQLQQQTEMWHNYQETMRPRSSGNSYMIQEVASSPYSQQHLNPDPNTANMLMENKQHQQRQTHSVNSNNSNTSMPLTPPHSNENVPPDEASLNEKSLNGGVDGNGDGFESKHVIEATGQPLMENNFQQQQQQQSNDGYLNQLYQMPQQFEGAKVKKSRNSNTKKVTKPLPDFNEAFGSTERGRFQSPPDPHLAPNKEFLDYYFEDSPVKFDDYQI